MFEHIKHLLKDIVAYGFSSVLAKFIGVFLTPFYTRVFEPADYGTMSILTSLTSLIGILSIMGLDNSTARWYYDTRDEEDRKVTINNFGWTVMFMSFVFGVILYLGSNLFSVYFLEDINASIYVKMVAISLPITSWTAIAMRVLQYARRPKQAVAISVSSMFITILLNVLFVLFLDFGLTGVYLALLLNGVIVLFISFYLIREWVKFPSIDADRLYQMLKFSLPLVPGSIFSWVTTLSSVYILLFYMNKTEVGLFQIGYSIASLILIVINSFKSAFGPYALSIIDRDNVKQIYSLFFEVYVVFMTCLVFAMVLFSKDVLVLLTPQKYHEAYLVAALLVVANFVSSLLEFASLGATIQKQTKPIGTGLVLSGLFLLICCHFLIPWFGKSGAAINIILADLVGVSYVFVRSQRVYPISFKFMPLSVLFLLFIGVAFLGVYLLEFYQFSFWSSFLIKVTISISSLFILLWRYSDKLRFVLTKMNIRV